MKVKFNEILAHRIADAREQVRRLEREFSEDTLQQTGLKVGQIMRNPNTGATYSVESARCYVNHPGQLPSVVIEGRRIYSTGRSPASSSSYLSLTTLELVS